MLDFRIDTFLTVCEYMNFTKAAEALHITQPAVSQHIRYLEKEYQVKLFSYEGKRIRLTPAGELLNHAAVTLKNDQRFMQEQLLLASSHKVSLSFGTTMTIGEAVISAPLAAYIKQHPNANISMTIGNTDELLHKLNSGTIHFALVEGYYDREEYDSMIYKTEPFIPVCAADHQFLEEPSLLRDLLKERILIREPGSGTRDILEKNLSVKNLRLDQFAHVTEIGNMHVILELLAQDTGITFLYKTAVEKGIQQGIYRELHLDDFHMEHDFAFIWNKGSIYSDTYRKICAEMRLEG